MTAEVSCGGDGILMVRGPEITGCMGGFARAHCSLQNSKSEIRNAVTFANWDCSVHVTNGLFCSNFFSRTYLNPGITGSLNSTKCGHNMAKINLAWPFS